MVSSSSKQGLRGFPSLAPLPHRIGNGRRLRDEPASIMWARQRPVQRQAMTPPPFSLFRPLEGSGSGPTRQPLAAILRSRLLDDAFEICARNALEYVAEYAA